MKVSLKQGPWIKVDGKEKEINTTTINMKLNF